MSGTLFLPFGNDKVPVLFGQDKLPILQSLVDIYTHGKDGVLFYHILGKIEHLLFHAPVNY